MPTTLTEEQRNIRVFAGVMSLVVVGLLVWGGSQILGPDRRVTRWDTSSVRVGEDGRSLELRYDATDCDDDYETEVEESTDRVVITVVLVLHARECNDMLVSRTAVVHLDEPLGDRELVEGR